MSMKIFLFKIKEGKVEHWRQWCNLLATEYKKEAIETLQEENLTYESFSIFSINGQHYTIGMTEGDAKPANMERELNQKHKTIKQECLERMSPVEMGYEIYNK